MNAPILLGACNRLRATGGSGMTFTPIGLPFPITWSTMKETNYNPVSIGVPSPSRCPVAGVSPSEIDVVGTITEVSGPWTKQFLGGTVAFDSCVAIGPTDQEYATGLVPGTVFTISY